LKEKVCVNCKHGAIGISPSVGGFNAGVYCHSKAMAGELDEQTHGDTEAVKEFEQVGCLNRSGFFTCSGLSAWMRTGNVLVLSRAPATQ